MKRGILAVTDTDIKLLSQLTNKSEVLKESHLETRLNSKHRSHDLQLNEEETEILLDLLPVPSENPKQEETELREKLLQFLRKLRG